MNDEPKDDVGASRTAGSAGAFHSGMDISWGAGIADGFDIAGSRWPRSIENDLSGGIRLDIDVELNVLIGGPDGIESFDTSKLLSIEKLCP